MKKFLPHIIRFSITIRNIISGRIIATLLLVYMGFLCGIDSFAQSGSTCSNPFIISSLPFTQTGMTTCGFGDDYSSGDACGSSYMNGDDFIFQYTPGANESVSINLTNTANWVGVFVFDGCPSSMGTNCISSNTNSSGNPGIGSVNLIAGQTYYIMVSTWPSPQCSVFDITIGPPPPPNTQDCDGAIPVCQDIYSEVNAFSGTGNIPGEIDAGISCLGSGEKNDVWYIFTVQTSGDVCFTITPNDLSDDYDWAVFDLTSANCSDIFTDPTLEVSCNYSGTSGATGPNGNPGNQNEPCIPVNAGETYVINVSQFSTSTSGYTLDFSTSTAAIFDNIDPFILSVNTPISCGATSLTFNFSENILCSTVEDADFQLTGPGGPYTLTNVTGAACAIGANMENTFTVNVSPSITAGGNFDLCLVSGSGLVTDLCGNVAIPSCLTFTMNCLVVIMTDSVDVSCFGSTDGSATVSVSNGVPPYTYSWSPSGGTSATATGLSPGTYTVTVTDANGSIGVATVTINEPPPFVATTTGSVAVCSCPCSGSAYLFPTGGTPTYTIIWSNGYTDQFQTGLCDGTYTVTLTDANGCTATGSVTLP